MADLREETGKIIPGANDEVVPTIPGGDKSIDKLTTPELNEAIKATTGIDFTTKMQYRNDEERRIAQTPANYTEVDDEEDASASAPAPASEKMEPNEDAIVETRIPGVGSFVSPEDAEKLGAISGPEHVINPDDAYKEALDKKVAKIKAAEAANYKAMEDAVLGSEEDRLKRLEATLALPDDHPDKIKLMESRRAMDRDAAASGMIEVAAGAKERREADKILEGVGGYDPSDLVPSYEMSDEEEDKETPKAEPKPDPDPDDDDYGEFVRSLPVAEFTKTKNPVITTKREPTVDVVASDWDKKKKGQPLGDQAFMNAVAKFKKNHFGVKRAYLVNSGLIVDVVGSGVVDMQNMYMNVDRNTRMYDYQMEQMRILIQNIVGCQPKINPNVLRDKIHYADFQMIAFAHICATLDKLEAVGNCSSCGKAFRVNGKPEELLLNMDELHERAVQIENADSVDSVSLLGKYRIVTCTNGMVVTLGHPSYANELAILNSFAAYYNRMAPMEAKRFQSMLRTMYVVRKIVLPNGIQTNSLLQIYEAIKLMTQEDLELIQENISEMNKDIIRPKFGIRETVCPHCGEVVKNIEYEDILNMLFLHTQLNVYLNEKTEQ